MMRLASSLAVGDTVGNRNAVVVAIEPLEGGMLRLTLFVDGGVYQQDAHAADTFDAESPPALLEALQALADLAKHAERERVKLPVAELRRAFDVLSSARRLGIMTRFAGDYSVRRP